MGIASRYFFVWPEQMTAAPAGGKGAEVRGGGGGGGYLLIHLPPYKTFFRPRQ